MWEKPQTVFHKMYQVDERIQTQRRPKTSARGARAIGPKAMDRTKIETTMFASLSVIERSVLMEPSAGASIEALMSVTIPPMEQRRVMAHRRVRDQLNGQEGSV